MINRDNYEEKVIDWLDGNLDIAEVDELLSFLDRNPDLKVEVDMLQPEKLDPPSISFLNKNNLKKEASELPISQVEYLSVASLENDITDEQSTDLQKIINSNPQALEVYASIQKLRLTPQKISYQHKNSLKRMTLTTKVIRIVGASAAAAAVVLLLILPLSNEPSVSNSPLIADNEPVTTLQNDITATVKNDSNKPIEETMQQTVDEPAEPDGLLIADNSILNSRQDVFGNNRQTELETANNRQSESINDPETGISQQAGNSRVREVGNTEQEPLITQNSTLVGDEINPGETVRIETIQDKVVQVETIHDKTYRVEPVQDKTGRDDQIKDETNRVEPVQDDQVREIESRPFVVGNYYAMLDNTSFLNIEQTPLQCQVELPEEETIDYSDRTIVGKLIAKTFRKNVLNHPEATDSPIRGYEVAEVWIAALNKLWETDMMLTKNENSSGEVETVVFNSRLINFDTKVKNNEDDL